MKKIILAGGVVCLLAGFPASAQTAPSFGEALASSLMYPQSAQVSRRNNNDQYWNRIHFNQEMRDQEREREEARKNDHHDNGHHYAYGKDPKHHKAGWKDQSKSHGKNDGKKPPKFHGENRAKDPNKRADNK